MRLRDQCNFSSEGCVILCGGPVYEEISRPIKHLHLQQLLHATIHFVAFAVPIRIRTNGSTAILIRFSSIFVCRIRICHSHYAQVDSQL